MRKMTHKKPSFEEENILWKNGYYVIGVDEVGRGAFAGPLVVGAVVYPSLPAFKETPYEESPLHKKLYGVRDSKMLSAKKRSFLETKINEMALTVCTAEVSVSEINKVGIGNANQIGFRKAIQKVQSLMPNKKLFVFVDGFKEKYVRGVGLKNQKAIVKGDQKSYSIASASIIAKVHRDNLMSKLSTKYNKYGFERHKGYGTKFHREKIKKFGLSDIHRKDFCRNIIT